MVLVGGAAARRRALAAAWRAIAAGLGEADWPTAYDPALVAALAEVHRLSGALGDVRLAAGGVAWEPALVAAFAQAHAAQTAAAVQRLRPLRGALAALHPLPAIVLKGAALAERLYPSLGGRGMGDVDLLVRAADLPAALDRLAQVGQRKLYPGHPVLDAADFHERQLQGADLAVDLHQAFLQRRRLSVDYAAVFARAVPWEGLADNAFLLAPEDAFVHGAVHLAIGEFGPQWAPAIGALDLQQMVRRRGPLWGTGPELRSALVRQRSREWGAERMLFASVRWTGAIFPRLAEGLEAFAPAIGRMPRVVLERLVVAPALPPPLGDPSRAEMLLRKALLLPPRAALAFAAERLAARLGL